MQVRANIGFDTSIDISVANNRQPPVIGHEIGHFDNTGFA